MKKAPKIRFDGYTEDWEQRKLSAIITEKLSNGVINKSGTEDSNVKHINVINMSDCRQNGSRYHVREPFFCPFPVFKSKFYAGKEKLQ